MKRQYLQMNQKLHRLLFYSVLLTLLFTSSWACTAEPPSDNQTSASSEERCNGYLGLQKALVNYREIAERGGWPAVSKGLSLKKGDISGRVAALRKRLAITGDFVGDKVREENLFDEELLNAVIRFQRRHGLIEDGVVGTETAKALNVPVEKRIRQIEINMERLREMPSETAPRYITVNIAAFELQVVENENPVMSMKVIVGKPYWHSPLFSAKMTHLVFNPSWYIPNSIARKEVLPKIKKEPDYLTREGIKVFENGTNYRKALDASAIKWADVTADNFKYRLVQIPGERNPLGKIKFVFPNKYNVYLHDTPAKVLFARSNRAFSHGCIRIEKPVELAEYVFRDDPSWTRDRINEMIAAGKEVKVMLPSPINVHILYMTAWVGKDNVLQFREDVYGRDQRAE